MEYGIISYGKGLDWSRERYQKKAEREMNKSR
jgi:hypothetical protein